MLSPDQVTWTSNFVELEIVTEGLHEAGSSAMCPDCIPVKGEVPGPAHHLLCARHGHVLDIRARKIIAASLEQYKANMRASSARNRNLTMKAPAPDGTPVPPLRTNPEVPANTAPESADTLKLLNLLKQRPGDFEEVVRLLTDREKEIEDDGLLSRAVAGVSHLLGDAKDPSGALVAMRIGLLAEYGAGLQAVGSHDPAEARKRLANMDEMIEKARHLVMAYTTDVSGAERAVTGLKVASKAGDIATAGLEAVAPPIGKGLSVLKKAGVAAMEVHLDDKVNWGEFGAEVAADLLFDKIGGDAVTKKVCGPVTAKLIEKFGKKVSKEFIEKSVEEVVKSEMKTVAKTAAGGVYDAAKGKDITYQEFFSQMIHKMTDPNELLMVLISSKIQAEVGE